MVKGRRRSATKPKHEVWTKILLRGSKPVLALDLSPSENFLALVQSSVLSVYDLDRDQVVNVLTKVNGRITAVAWDPREELIALGLADGTVYIWHFRGGRFAGKDHDRALEKYSAGFLPLFA